jgi:hypothetical protein
MPAMLKVHAWNNMTVFLQQFWVRGFVLPRLLLSNAHLQVAAWKQQLGTSMKPPAQYRFTAEQGGKGISEGGSQANPSHSPHPVLCQERKDATANATSVEQYWERGFVLIPGGSCHLSTGERSQAAAQERAKSP